jgi:hypothetical protein
MNITIYSWSTRLGGSVELGPTGVKGTIESMPEGLRLVERVAKGLKLVEGAAKEAAEQTIRPEEPDKDRR